MKKTILTLEYKTSDSDSSDSDSDSSFSGSDSDSSSDSDSEDEKSSNKKQKITEVQDQSPSKKPRLGGGSSTPSSPASTEETSSSRTASNRASPIPAGDDRLLPGQRKHFSRIDRSEISFEHGTLMDNTSNCTTGTWGENADEKLMQDFTKNKNKMKRGSITLATGSDKFTPIYLPLIVFF